MELLGQLRNLTESGQLEVLVGDSLFTATGLHYTSTNNTGCPQGWMPYIDRCCKFDVLSTHTKQC